MKPDDTAQPFDVLLTIINSSQLEMFNILYTKQYNSPIDMFFCHKVG